MQAWSAVCAVRCHLSIFLSLSRIGAKPVWISTSGDGQLISLLACTSPGLACSQKNEQAQTPHWRVSKIPEHVRSNFSYKKYSALVEQCLIQPEYRKGPVWKIMNQKALCDPTFPPVGGMAVHQCTDDDTTTAWLRSCHSITICHYRPLLMRNLQHLQHPWKRVLRKMRNRERYQQRRQGEPMDNHQMDGQKTGQSKTCPNQSWSGPNSGHHGQARIAKVNRMVFLMILHFQVKSCLAVVDARVVSLSVGEIGGKTMPSWTSSFEVPKLSHGDLHMQSIVLSQERHSRVGKRSFKRACNRALRYGQTYYRGRALNASMVKPSWTQKAHLDNMITPAPIRRPSGIRVLTWNAGGLASGQLEERNCPLIL